MFIERLKKYENIIGNLQSILATITHWGTPRQVPAIKRVISRLSEINEIESGLDVWLRLRWYPVLILMYSSGISAIANGKYDMLASLFMTKVQYSRWDKAQEAIRVVMAEITDTHDMFKEIPGHERKYVPRSEYQFKLLQPKMEDLFF